MDNSTIQEKAANVRHYFDHDAAKQALKEKYEAKLLFAQGDGMWKAGPELISALRMWTLNSMVLLDEYGNPCKVDRDALEREAKMRWQEVMNAWLEEFESLRRER
jgi:hypothetical protein